MNAIVIHEALNQILTFVKSKNLISEYQMLIELVNNAENSESIENDIVRKRFRDLSSILESECFFQSRFLFNSVCSHLESNKIIGLNASKILESTYQKYKYDFKKLSEALLELKCNLENSVSGIERTQSELKNIESSNENFFNKSTLLNVHLPADKYVNTLDEVEGFIRVWNKILNSFSHLSGSEDKMFHLAVWSNEYACIRLEDADEVLHLLSKALIRMLNSYRSILKIRFIQSKVSEMNLNPEIISLLEAEIDSNINEQGALIIDELAAEKGLNRNNSNYKDITGQAHRSLLIMLDFIEQGGKIDWQFPGKENYEEINVYYQIIEEIYQMQFGESNNLLQDSDI